MTNFVRGSQPIWLFRDLTGSPLNDEYYVSFLSNIFPYLPSLVYQSSIVIPPSPVPAAAWPNPIQLLANGALPDNVYFEDDVVYRLEVRHGPLQSDQLLYVINDYVPGSATGAPSIISEKLENQVSNGQFQTISFGGGTTVSSPIPTLNITTSGVYQLAPDWYLTLTGSGTGKVQQIVSTGNQITSVNPIPPYYLEITLNGWSTAVLSQRFRGNGGIWTGNWVYVSMIGQSNNGAYETVSINLVPSAGATTSIASSKQAFAPGQFQTFNGTAQLDIPYGNTDLNNVAYVDLQIVLPGTSITDISDIYLTVVTSNLSLQPSDFTPSPDETIERQTDHLFHYYKNSAIYQPKDSLLTGWIFPLNPYQFVTPTITTVAAQCSYIADQTILYQEGANLLQSGKATNVPDRGGLLLQPVAAATATRFAVIQYIDPSSIAAFWSSTVSSLVRAKLYSPNNPKTPFRLKMRLLSRATLPSTIGNTEPIASWPVGGDPVFSAGWSEIKPLNDPAYLVGSTQDPNDNTGSFPSYSFDSFLLPDQSAVTQTLAIVLYSLDKLNPVAVTGVVDNIVFDKISLVPNQFGVDANPITYDECLRQCQFYYEKSYDGSTQPLTITTSGLVLQSQGPTFELDEAGILHGICYAKSFPLNFKQVKRNTATIKFYSGFDATADVVSFGCLRDAGYIVAGGPNPSNRAITAFNATGSAIDGEYYISNATSTALIDFAPTQVGDEVILTYHYTADSRLGR